MNRLGTQLLTLNGSISDSTSNVSIAFPGAPKISFILNGEQIAQSTGRRKEFSFTGCSLGHLFLPPLCSDFLGPGASEAFDTVGNRARELRGNLSRWAICCDR